MRTVIVALAPLAQITSSNLWNTTLWNTLTNTLQFNQDVTSASIPRLPPGVTAVINPSRKNVSIVLTIDPRTFVFTSATQSFSFTLLVNGQSFTETASVTDVAPIAIVDQTPIRTDDNAGDPFTPITGICPIWTDQFGRTLTCSVSIEGINENASSGGLRYDSVTNSIVWPIDLFRNSSWQVVISVGALNSTWRQSDVRRPIFVANAG